MHWSGAERKLYKTLYPVIEARMNAPVRKEKKPVSVTVAHEDKKLNESARLYSILDRQQKEEKPFGNIYLSTDTWVFICFHSASDLGKYPSVALAIGTTSH
jgi:hypothetical protein